MPSAVPDLETTMNLRLHAGNRAQAVDRSNTGRVLPQARLLRKQVEGPAVYEREARANFGRGADPSKPFRLKSSDTIAFVDPTTFPDPVSRIRRFGDDEHHAELFAELARECEILAENPRFIAELDAELLKLIARPSLLQPASRLSLKLGGAQIFLKREDLCGEDRHLLLSVAGQGLIARRLGRETLVTGTKDGRRGVATAYIAAKLGLKAIVYMDQRDLQRHTSNVFRLKLLGASLRAVDARNLRNGDIREAALAECGQQRAESFLVTGLDAAPLPYPMLLRNAISSIGRECRRQLLAATQHLPATVIARNGNTADALGVFPAFLADKDVGLVCVEAAATPEPPRKDSEFDAFDPTRQPLTATQTRTANSILQGLEYPSVRREHEWLKSSGRVHYVKVEQAAAKEAITAFSQKEGFIPPLETAYVLAWACRAALELNPEQSVVAVIAQQAHQDIWDIGRLMGVSL